MMKSGRFSFKNEGMWLTISSFALPVLGVSVYLILALVKYLKS